MHSPHFVILRAGHANPPSSEDGRPEGSSRGMGRCLAAAARPMAEMRGAGVGREDGTGSHVGRPLRGIGAFWGGFQAGRGRADTQVCPYEDLC